VPALILRDGIDPLSTALYNPAFSGDSHGSEPSMDAAQWGRCVRLSVTEGALATAMGTLISGVFLTGFALSLGASRMVIGVLAALPALANIAQLAGAWWLQQRGQRKAFCIGSLAASRLLWLSILCLPWLVTCGGEQAALCALVALVAISSLLSSLGGVAWLSWIRDLVPAQRRLGFLGLRNQFDTLLALLLSVAGALFLDAYNGRHPGSMTGFLLVLTAAVFCGLAGIPLLSAIPDPGMSRQPPVSTAALWRLPLRERNFRRLLLFYVCWNMSSHLAAPFFAVFLLEKLRLPFWHITALYTLSSLTGLLANRYWTRLGQRFGTRTVVFLATLGDAFFPLFWIFLTPSNTWALPLIFLWGAFNMPLAVGGPTLVMRVAPEKNAAWHLAMFNALMGPVIALAAIVGGCLAGSVATDPAALSSSSLGGLKLLFLLSFAGRLMSLLVLKGVAEPGSATLGALLAELRRTADGRWRGRRRVPDGVTG
jgi:MFS family permease